MMESDPTHHASMSKGEAASADHARETLERSHFSSQQDAITALITEMRDPENWREPVIGKIRRWADQLEVINERGDSMSTDVRYEPQTRMPTEPQTMDEKLLRDPWTPLRTDRDVYACPVCGAMVNLGDVQTHGGWHLR